MNKPILVSLEQLETRQVHHDNANRDNIIIATKFQKISFEEKMNRVQMKGSCSSEENHSWKPR